MWVTMKYVCPNNPLGANEGSDGFLHLLFYFRRIAKPKINLLQEDNRQIRKNHRQSSEDNRRKEGIIANEVKSK